MARPTLITISGQFLKVDGTPETGTIIFRSNVYALYSQESVAQVPSPMSATLDSSGNFEIQVPATDDPAWAPADWTYTLIIKLSNDYSIYEVSVPYDATGGELSLAELIPTSEGSGPIDPGNYAPLVHNHAASDIVSGTIALARLPVGTTSSTVAAGDHTHSGGGGDIDPATTVVSETTYNQSSAVGIATEYARADHTHGTPALPTPSAIGAANSTHTHSASDVNSGTLNIARIPTGTTGTTVALGNDSRFSDARTPTAHAASHASAGSDPVTLAQSQITGLTTDLASKANTADLATVATTGSYNDLLDTPTIPVTSVAGKTGDVILVKADVGLSNVDNTSDTNKPISSATQAALDLKAPLTSPSFTGTVSGITKAMVGLGNVDNTSDANKPVSTAQQSALDLKADLASPTFTGTVSGITKAMVGLGNVDNTSDATKNSATATLSNKTLASPAFTGTPTGLTKSHVGLANVDNTADADKPISTATQTALDAKASVTSVTAVSDRVTAVEDMTPVIMVWNGSAYVESTTARVYVGPSDPGSVPNGSVWIDTDA